MLNCSLERFSCEEYCVGLSTRNNPVVVDDCINLGATAFTFKSLCKCKYLEGDKYVKDGRNGYKYMNMRDGPKGLAGLACNTMYLGQLVKGAIKTVAVP